MSVGDRGGRKVRGRYENRANKLRNWKKKETGIPRPCVGVSDDRSMTSFCNENRQGEKTSPVWRVWDAMQFGSDRNMDMSPVQSVKRVTVRKIQNEGRQKWSTAWDFSENDCPATSGVIKERTQCRKGGGPIKTKKNKGRKRKVGGRPKRGG